MSSNQKIIDRGYNEALNAMRKAPKVYTKVGFPLAGELKEKTKTGNSKPIESMPEMIIVAGIHEFGAPEKNIPERSFIRTSFDENIETIDGMKVEEYRKVMQGKQTAEVAIGRIGEFLVNKTKEKIREGISPELKYREGTPLYDTGQLINTIQHIEGERRE